MLAALQSASILIYLVLELLPQLLFFSLASLRPFYSFFFLLFVGFAFFSCVSCHAFHFPPKCIKKYCCCMVGYEQRVSFLIKFMVIVSTVNLSKFFMLRTKLCPALGSQPASQSARTARKARTASQPASQPGIAFYDTKNAGRSGTGCSNGCPLVDCRSRAKSLKYIKLAVSLHASF